MGLWARASVAVVVLTGSGCRPELSFFPEFRPNRVLMQGPTADLRLDVFRPRGYFGPVAISAGVERLDGLPVEGANAWVAAPRQEALTNRVVVSLDTVAVPSEIVVVARGELDGEAHEASATLDLSLLGSWTITTPPPAEPVRPGSTVTFDVEATGFNVEGTLELTLRMTSGQLVFGPVTRTTTVTTSGRNNVPIARFSAAFPLPTYLNEPLKVSIRGRLAPARPMIVAEEEQLTEFEVRVNE